MLRMSMSMSMSMNLASGDTTLSWHYLYL